MSFVFRQNSQAMPLERAQVHAATDDENYSGINARRCNA